MMNWNKGYSARYRCAIVDPVTWRDTETFEITDGSVNHTDSGLRESAELSGVRYEHGPDKWIRIRLITEQGQDAENTALFTGLTSTPQNKYKGVVREDKIQCYSVLKPAQETLLDRGWYAPKGFIGAELVRDLLTIGPAPVSIEGESPRLSQHIVAEDKENNLTMSYKILEAIGWRLRISGTGEISVCPKAQLPSASYDPQTNDMIEPEVDNKSDWFDAPNVLRCIDAEGNQCTVYDDDPGSPLSSVSRGRRIWDEDSDISTNDQETLLTYGRRKLKELQSRSRKISYNRCYDPKVMQSDLIELNYPAQELSGYFYVVSQKIILDASATTSEEVKQSWTQA